MGWTLTIMRIYLGLANENHNHLSLLWDDISYVHLIAPFIVVIPMQGPPILAHNPLVEVEENGDNFVNSIFAPQCCS